MLTSYQDDKDLPKSVEASQDVEMKVEEPSSGAVIAHGDISPITGTISNLPDPLDISSQDAKKKKARKTEPSFEKLPNLSRVTPAQIAHVSFPSEGRYIPVRPASSYTAHDKGKASINTPPSETVNIIKPGSTSGGGILLLIDQQPDEPAEYFESELQSIDSPPAADVTPVEQLTTSGPAGATNGSSFAGRSHIALDENAPEADPPGPFEYPFDDDTK